MRVWAVLVGVWLGWAEEKENHGQAKANGCDQKRAKKAAFGGGGVFYKKINLYEERNRNPNGKGHPSAVSCIMIPPDKGGGVWGYEEEQCYKADALCDLPYSSKAGKVYPDAFGYEKN